MTSHQKRIIVTTQAKTLTANQYMFCTLYGFKYNLLGSQMYMHKTNLQVTRSLFCIYHT